MTSKSTLLGAAGEHYVMCQLLRRGYIAALAPAGVPNCDIIVTDDIGERLFAIQVKTRNEKGYDGGWHMSKKHENLVADTLLYAFVNFGRSLDDQPVSYLVPSVTVAETLQAAHQAWLSTPGKKGQQRKDTDFRRFLPDYGRVDIDIGCDEGWLDQYRENWAILLRDDRV